MAFNGVLLKVGGTEIPLHYIKMETYKVNAHARQDLDSFRDANGKLQRNVLAHTATKITLTIKSLKSDDMVTLMSILNGGFSNKLERKSTVTYYSPDTDSYDSGEFYCPDFNFTICRIDHQNKLHYNEFELKFIEY